MKKRTIILISLALLLALPATLGIWGFLLPCQYDGTFMGELKYKVRRLEDTEEPRIILVGGSGVAFGVDSAAMERALPGYTVVNFGMYAALGTTVMLDLSEDLIRPGDIVILIPEQQAQTLSDYFDAAVLWQGLDGDLGLLRRLPGEKLGRLLGQFPAFAGQKFSYFLTKTKPEPQGVYARASFNEYGDVASPLCARNEMPEGFDPNTPIRFDGPVLSDGFVDRVNDYADKVRQRGGVLWYAMCPMNEKAITGSETPEDFYDTLQARLTFPVIGDPNDSVLAAEWFYDTNFHLNNSGKLVYTRVLLDGIKAMLGDSSPNDIPMPPMPEMAEGPLWQGDDIDAAYFRYAEQGDAWAIVGLTEDGAAREALTVPSTWQGKPVRAITSLSPSGRLKELRIQRNIQSIADGAFSGCERLERLVLDQETPSACRVGQGLLTGTDAVLYVPERAVSAYQTDYFWSIYGPSIQASAAE